MNNSVVDQYTSSSNIDDYKKKRKKRRLIIILIILILLIPIGWFLYKRFFSNIEIENVDLIYNVVKDDQNYYDEETNTKYIYLVIYNYKDNEESKVDLSYDITIKNKENSNGIFKVIDIDSGDETEFLSEVNVKGEMESGVRREKRLKIFIGTNEVIEGSQVIDYEIVYSIKKK